VTVRATCALPAASKMMLPPPTGTPVTLSTTCPRTICAGTGPAMRRYATTSQAVRRTRRCAASIKTLPESLSPCCESYYARLYIGGARHRRQGPVLRGAGDGTRLRPSDGGAGPRPAPGDRVPRGRRPGPTVRGRELRAGGDELRRAASALPRARLRRDAARAGAGRALRVL